MNVNLNVDLNLDKVEELIQRNYLTYLDIQEKIAVLSWDMSSFDSQLIDMDTLSYVWNDCVSGKSGLTVPVLEQDQEVVKLQILYHSYLNFAPSVPANADEIILLSAYYNDTFNSNTHIDFSNDSIHYNHFSLLLMRTKIKSHTQHNLIFDESTFLFSSDKSIRSFIFYMAINGQINTNLLAWYYVLFSSRIKPALADLMISLIFSLNDPRRSSLFHNIMRQLNYPTNTKMIANIKEYVEKTNIIYDNPNINRPLNILLNDLRFGPDDIDFHPIFDITIDNYYKLYNIDPLGGDVAFVKDWFTFNSSGGSWGAQIQNYNTTNLLKLTSSISIIKYNDDTFRCLYNIAKGESISFNNLSNIIYNRRSILNRIQRLFLESKIILDRRVDFAENMKRLNNISTIVKEIHNKHYKNGYTTCSECSNKK